MADGIAVRPLHVFAPGFPQDPQIRRILRLAGWRITLGLPGRRGAIGVWGRKPMSAPGRRMAGLTDAGLLTIEDGFLRSVHPGVTGEAPLSLILDAEGIYYDASRRSRLERLIQTGEGLDDTVLARARAGIARLREAGLSKYTPVARGTGWVPEAGYVLVIDQTAGDASIGYGAASGETFRDMLASARAENPSSRIVIRTHPDVLAGKKTGHFSPADLRPGDLLHTEASNPWELLEGASAVYTVTSQLGFEGLIAGKRVRVFGLPFYAGWGLTEDAQPIPRRVARPSLEAVFAAAYLLYPVYADPWRDRLASFEETVEALTFLSARRGTDPAHRGEVYVGFHPWKRVNTLRYGRRYPLPAAFESDPGDAIARGRAEGRRVWFWASKVAPAVLDRAKAEGVTAGSVEDGFLRSVGLGANLIDAGSLVFDDLGIYYDPSRPSRLETLIAEAALLDPAGPECARAAALRGQIVAARVTKYNVGRTETLPAAGGRPVVLVPGQVEDDASIERGAAGTVCTNLALLQAARAGNPHAFLIYKPHPDVEAGLRKGKVPDAEAARLADHIARDASAVDLLDRTDRLWTMTSLMGFEALLRGIPVTCLGQPFYAGWGLTDDHGPACPRRTSRPKLDHLVHAVLIAYPSYVDPVSGLPCPPELAVERLAAGHVRKGGPGQRLVSKAQGMMAALGLVWWR